jgi:hypothetical protein
MREPRKFPKVLTGVMITLLCGHLFNVFSFGSSLNVHSNSPIRWCWRVVVPDFRCRRSGCGLGQPRSIQQIHAICKPILGVSSIASDIYTFETKVQFLYSLAILLSIPLQFFPAVRILENGLFVRSGKQNPRVKWLKNLFRFGLVALSTVLSCVGAADLDKFVSLIGSFAW